MSWSEDRIKLAVHSFQEYYNEKINGAVILGSGLDLVFSNAELITEIPFSILPLADSIRVEGHQNIFQVIEVNSLRILVQRGRVHLYQGYTAFETALSVAMMAGLGISNLIITNASGGIKPGLSQGEIAVIRDHINLQGENCLTGAPHAFIDMTQAYDTSWYSLLDGCKLQQLVYCALKGPSYETPAERIRMTIGILTIEISVPILETIKEQRNITRSIRDKVRQKFNVSIAEVPLENGLRGQTSIAICAVNSDNAYVQSVLSNAFNLVERFYPDIISRYHIETIVYQA